eukprot:PhM_4_TR8043/c1_g1_i1/m.106631
MRRISLRNRRSLLGATAVRCCAHQTRCSSDASSDSSMWKCTVCQFPNFAFRDVCMKCRATRVDSPAAAVAAADSSAAPTTFAASAAPTTTTARFAAPQPLPKWQCVCGAWNAASAATCCKCGEDQMILDDSPNLPPSQQQQPPRGGGGGGGYHRGKGQIRHTHSHSAHHHGGGHGGAGHHTHSHSQHAPHHTHNHSPINHVAPMHFTAALQQHFNTVAASVQTKPSAASTSDVPGHESAAAHNVRSFYERMLARGFHAQQHGISVAAGGSEPTTPLSSVAESTGSSAASAFRSNNNNNSRKLDAFGPFGAAMSNPTYTLEGPRREGVHELLCDYEDATMTQEWYGNISSFIRATTPVVPVHPHEGHAAETSKVCYRLSDLWKFFDTPYGHEVAVDNPHPNWLRDDEALFYMPLLSGFNFVDAKSGKRYEHYLACPPNDRPPLTQYMDTIVNSVSFSDLKDAWSCGFTFSSWISVLWYPIHCQHHTPQRSAGTVLTYYFINPLRCTDTCSITTNIGPVLDMPSALLRQEVVAGLATPPPQQEDMEVANTIGSTMSDPAPQRTMCASLFGMVPYRARSEVWYRWLGSGLYCAPLQLIKNSNVLLERELRRAEGGFDTHPDFVHYLRYDRSLFNFLDSALVY